LISIFASLDMTKSSSSSSAGFGDKERFDNLVLDGFGDDSTLADVKKRSHSKVHLERLGLVNV
jgi:hypothetical protein